MIALDVMGGDYAPEQIVIGALNAAKRSIPLILVGHQDVIKKHLNEYDAKWQNYPITIFHTTDVIKMDEDPIMAVRQKKDSSIVKIIELVKSGKAQVAVSAGNSGAVMVAATFILGRLEGIERPAIAGLLPTSQRRKVLALDLGANTACRPEHLLQFALLGAQYSEKNLEICNPRVALLSNGQEDCKGNLVTKEAFTLLKKSGLNFVGNMEPGDVFKLKTDVIVCDGFAGNVFLKTLESAFELLADLVRHDVEREKRFDSMIVSGFCNFIYTTAKNSLVTSGAPLLGVKGNVLICHGNSSADVIEKALISCTNVFRVK